MHVTRPESADTAAVLQTPAKPPRPPSPVVDDLDGHLEAIMAEQAKPYRGRLVELLGLIAGTSTGRKVLDYFRDLAGTHQRPKIDVRAADASPLVEGAHTSRVLWLSPDMLNTQATEIGVPPEAGHASTLLWNLATVHNALASRIDPRPEKLDPDVIQSKFRAELSQNMEAMRFRSASVNIGQMPIDGKRASLPDNATLLSTISQEGKPLQLVPNRRPSDTPSIKSRGSEPPPEPYSPTVTSPKIKVGKWQRFSQFARRPLNWVMQGVDNVGRLFTRGHRPLTDARDTAPSVSTATPNASTSNVPAVDTINSTSDETLPDSSAKATASIKGWRAKTHKRTESSVGNRQPQRSSDTPQANPTAAALLSDAQK